MPCNKAVPDANTIRMLVKRLKETLSLLKTGKNGLRRYVKTIENVQLGRAAIERSPRRSACNHAVAFGCRP